MLFNFLFFEEGYLMFSNFWDHPQVPLKATPHQVTYFAEKNLYPIIVSFPVSICLLF